MALFVDDGDHSGGVAVLLGVALRAQGGVGIACGVWWAVCGGSLWGLLAVLWAGAEECGRWEALQVLSACCLLPAACCPTYDFY